MMMRVRRFIRGKMPIVLGSTLFAGAMQMALPSLARADSYPPGCWCNNTYCQQTGGSIYMRWCCAGNGGSNDCGCTLMVTSCYENME